MEMHALNFKCPEELFQFVKELAKEDSRSVSSYVVHLLKKHVEEVKKNGR